MNKKYLFIPAAGLAILASTLYASSNVLASTNGSNQPAIVQKITDKFGLNPDEVRAVFEEERQAHMNEMQAKFEERLNEAVAAGEITEAQKQLILAKHEELKAKHQENMSEFGRTRGEMTQEAREEFRAEHETEREALEAWAEENGIDMKYVGMKLGSFDREDGRANHRVFKMRGQS